MREDVIRRHFESIGARVRFRYLKPEVLWWGRRDYHGLSIDIVRDGRGSCFEIALADDAPDLEVLQSRPRERHLLLFARDGNRFLCGHDERDWFVAAVPERVSTVRQARQALIPSSLREAANALPPSVTARRRNRLFRRQGEWFFVPVDRQFPASLIHRNEPIQRTPQSKPHVCEELYREGGETVYVFGTTVLTQQEYRDRIDADPKFAKRSHRTRIRNPRIFARGAVRHPDHSTLHLATWHRVLLSGERPITLESSVVNYID